MAPKTKAFLTASLGVGGLPLSSTPFGEFDQLAWRSAPSLPPRALSPFDLDRLAARLASGAPRASARSASGGAASTLVLMGGRADPIALSRLRTQPGRWTVLLVPPSSPARYALVGVSLPASSTGMAIEKLELCYEKIERVS